MDLSIVLPRTRPGHLATIASPESFVSSLLRLTTQDGQEFIAERDPSLPCYHVLLPAVEAGKELVCAAEEISDAIPARNVGYEEGDDCVKISLAGTPFMTFRYGADYPKPVINPILTPGGVNMLREPMAAYTEGEHPWQRGLTLMQGAINGVDCWNERREPGFGRTVQNSLSTKHQALSLLLESNNTWFEQDRPLFTDDRSYRLFDSPRDRAILDVAITLNASEGPITIGGTKEGGFLCIRVNPTMDAAVSGQMRNAYGATDETGCWSKPSHWMDYYGPVRDEEAGFAVFDHPDNLRYPTTWHVRGYGLFAPNCWMFRDDYHIAAGDSLTFRWRVVVHAGDTDQADIGNMFLDYVDGPRVAS
ncbi:MAG: PmoA family protein [Candidatus Latescibacteria bacterium]|nr:PmoA family protein [Candidatus Latescibacterota bacterium]